MEHKLWEGKHLERDGLFQVQHEPGGNGEFRENLFVDKEKLLMLLSSAPWRCVEATESYSRRPTGAHGQFYTISNSRASCVQAVQAETSLLTRRRFFWTLPTYEC